VWHLLDHEEINLLFKTISEVDLVGYLVEKIDDSIS
jgi:hypothetical protein